MKINLHLSIFILGLLFSCKHETIEVKNEKYNIYSDSLFKTKKRVSLIKLKSDVKNKANEFESFLLATNQIDSLNIAPYSKISEIAYMLTEQLDELPNELDTSLKTNSILSRINQIKTYSEGIIFEVSKNTKDTIKINKYITKVLNSYNNLITQLNETGLKLPDDFEKQLENPGSIKKDSIKGQPLF